MLEARIVAARIHGAVLGVHGKAQGAARMTPASDGGAENPVIARHRAAYADDVRTIRAPDVRATGHDTAALAVDLFGAHAQGGRRHARLRIVGANPGKRANFSMGHRMTDRVSFERGSEIHALLHCIGTLSRSSNSTRSSVSAHEIPITTIQNNCDREVHSRRFGQASWEYLLSDICSLQIVCAAIRLSLRQRY